MRGQKRSFLFDMCLQEDAFSSPSEKREGEKRAIECQMSLSYGTTWAGVVFFSFEKD